MAFLKSGFALETAPLLRGSGLIMRPPAPSDYAAWAEVRDVSRSHLIPWEPKWSRDELSRWAYRRRLRYYQRDQREDLGYAFFIFADGTGALMGGLTLSNIRRGVTQAAALGYWLGCAHTGQGHMRNAVTLAIDYAFDDLRLHRIEAACLPSNRASIGVLRSNGFEEEGLARRYLKINGAWCDHLLFALVSDDPRPSRDNRPTQGNGHWTRPGQPGGQRLLNAGWPQSGSDMPDLGPDAGKGTGLS